MRSFRSLALLLFFSSAAFSATPSPVKPRTALVIGNAHYEPAVGPLRNTVSDARAVAQSLRALGFAVIERHDVTRDQLLRVVDEFRKTLPGAEVALFYYAGHGISVDGSNYLIPLKSGFSPEGVDEVGLHMLAETRLFNAEQAVAEMDNAGAACNLVILDACRSTPVARVSESRGWSEHTGLTEMNPPSGSLIAFATEAGRTALDGNGPHGLYTEELLKYLGTPGLTIEQVFKRTRAGVLRLSNGSQIPVEYSRLVGDDVYLAGQPAPSPAPSGGAPDESIPVAVPTPAALAQLAAAGQVTACLNGLELIAHSQGPGSYAVGPISSLLEKVKNDLKQAIGPSLKVVTAADTCATILRLLPECLPPNDPAATDLAAKAHNRRGDAFLLLDRVSEAVAEYDAAQARAPNDPYILYNRGRAYLALDQKNEARADFAAAAAPRYRHSGVHKLAEKALAAIN